MNSLRDYLCNQLKKDRKFVERMLRALEGQSETGEVTYLGDALPDDWEHHFSKRLSMPIRNELAADDVAFIDWLSFTYSDESYRDVTKDPEEMIELASEELEGLLGYGITIPLDKGMNFYQKSYVLGNEWGFVCIGGQRNTLMVTLNGEGCSAARESWERKLYDWSAQTSRFHITRVDVAHDCFDKSYTVEKAVKDYDAGLFGMKGRLPKIQQYGNWRIPKDKAGRTVYVGKRKSGKLCRIYEKGKQIGDPESDWVRIECEWRSKNRFIPENILIHPGPYLAGAYPAFTLLSKQQNRIKTKTKRDELTYEKLLANLRRQSGKAINYVVKREGSLETAFEKMAVEGIPKRLKVSDWRDANTPIHARK